jgi:hypothetical protein
MVDIKTLLTFLAGAVIMLFVARLLKGKDSRTAERLEEIAKESQKVTELERQVAVLMSDAVPVKALVQALAIAKLTHIHTPEMDALLLKVGPPSTLTASEIDRMESLLRERAADPNFDEEERIWARIFPDWLRLNKLDADKTARGEEPETTIIKVVIPVDALEAK